MIVIPEHHLCTRCSCEIPTIVYVPGESCPYCSTCAIVTLFRNCQHEDGYQKRPFLFDHPMTRAEAEAELASLPTPAELEAHFRL